MQFAVVSLFPEFAEAVSRYGVVRRGVEAGLVEVSGINPRDLPRTVTDAWTTRPTAVGPAW